MALKKCKECGNDVSTKAKTCPKCGASAPKKTSLLTWIVLGFLGLFVYSVSKTPTSIRDSYSTNSSSPSSSTSSSSQHKQPVKAEPRKPMWTTQTSKDEMTGKSSAYANSPSTKPTRKMTFPYERVDSTLNIGCDDKGEWAYFHFSIAPNLSNTETQSGYNLIKTRVKWDDNVDTATLTQEWGAKFIHFKYSDWAISKIEEQSNTVLLELNWHGQNNVIFEYSLEGAKDALADIKSKCSKF